MIRLSLAATFAAGLLWVSGSATAADEAKPNPTGISPQTEKINDLIAKGWESAGIKKPADKAKDLEFMRRAFIDLIGRIPTPDEIRDFERDSSVNKRAKLVSRLLNNTLYEVRDSSGKVLKEIPGLKLSTNDDRTKHGIDYNNAYAENFAELWTTWMLTRSNTHQYYRNQFHAWMSNQFAKSTDPKAQFPDGKPWDNIVRDLIAAEGRSNPNGAVVFVIRHLGEPLVTERGAKGDLPKDGKFDAVPITSRVTKLFLGIQSQCVQCHNHPFNKEYVQSDFWGINGFFRQTDRSGTTNPNPRNLKDINPPPLELHDISGWNTRGIDGSELGRGMVMYERRDGQKAATAPAMLRDLAQFANGDKFSGKQLPEGVIPSKFEGKTRRQVLAQWVTEHDNFSRAFVNRMWGHLFGRGLNKEPSVDDFSSNNEVVHPELLDYLAEEFKKYNYDPKKLLEWICMSNVYGLSHEANKAYADTKYDPYFARMPLKAMSPEVLFDSLAVATQAETRKDKQAYDKLKNDWMLKLTQNFGDDEGNEVSFNGTVVQALLMMNGKELNGEIGSGKGNQKSAVAEVVNKKSSSDAIYDELFLMTVSRHVTPNERSELTRIRDGYGKVKLPTTPAPKGGKPQPKKGGGSIDVAGTLPNDVAAFYQDVFWALLNSREFMLNH